MSGTRLRNKYLKEPTLNRLTYKKNKEITAFH